MRKTPSRNNLEAVSATFSDQPLSEFGSTGKLILLPKPPDQTEDKKGPLCGPGQLLTGVSGKFHGRIIARPGM